MCKRFSPAPPLAVFPGWSLLLALFTAGCATQGPRPLSFHAPPNPAAGGAPAAEDLRLSLVTFNVWGLPAWLNRAGTERFPRIADELERSEPDLIALQEVWTRKAMAAVPRSDRWWRAVPARSKAFWRRSGLVTLSRHRIAGGEFRPFRAARFPDGLVTKGALKTTIELEDGRRLNLWNVHFQSGGAARARMRQVEELAGWVRQAEDGQIADLVAGDFNCEPGSAEFAHLSRYLGPGELELSEQRPFATYDAAARRRGIGLSLDHLFIRPRAPLMRVAADPRAVLAGDRPHAPFSDHLGVRVGLSLRLPGELGGFAEVRRP
jgi:endonuclease/exonuclease/phosphatase family metal-dependent hydrolase